MAERNCPICDHPLISETETTGDFDQFSCPGCGEFQITRTALACLPDQFFDNAKPSQAMTHYIWRKREGNDIPTINSDDVKSIIENPWLPGIEEQMQNLILLMGNESDGADADVCLGARANAIVGILATDDLWKLKEWAQKKGYVEDAGTGMGNLSARLTFDGWQRYEEIKKGALHTKDVFMAMGYGSQELDDTVANCFIPAVADTGFHLVRMDDRPEAGVMDNRMQLMIKRSRFLIADVTNSNVGAYWEAGFAFGLAKPVIYSCRKTEWDQSKAHFDVNHHLTIIWDPDNLDQAAKDLKAAIRNTIPEAKHED